MIDRGVTTPAPAKKKRQDQLVGQLLAGKYKILKKIGEGGMGSVYIANQEPIDRKVAVKVLLGKLAEDEIAVKRFEQEAKAISKMQHPNTVTIYDFGHTGEDEGERLYIVMEYLKGRTLTQVLRNDGQIAAPRSARIIRQVCASLADAHQAGIIHRDLKPDNIFLTEVGEDKDWVKVLDFGVAKLADAEGAGTLTQTGMIFGTPKYMSPEQAEGRPIDYRADIYALGVVLYELLVGRPPFIADTPVGLLLKHISEPPPAFQKVRPDLEIDPRMEAIVMKALEKIPDRRHQMVSDLAADSGELRALGHRDGPGRRRHRALDLAPRHADRGRPRHARRSSDHTGGSAATGARVDQPLAGPGGTDRRRHAAAAPADRAADRTGQRLRAADDLRRPDRARGHARRRRHARRRALGRDLGTGGPATEAQGQDDGARPRPLGRRWRAGALRQPAARRSGDRVPPDHRAREAPGGPDRGAQDSSRRRRPWSVSSLRLRPGPSSTIRPRPDTRRRRPRRRPRARSRSRSSRARRMRWCSSAASRSASRPAGRSCRRTTTSSPSRSRRKGSRTPPRWWLRRAIARSRRRWRRWRGDRRRCPSNDRRRADTSNRPRRPPVRRWMRRWMT